MYFCYFVNVSLSPQLLCLHPEFIPTYFQWHRYIIREELTSTQPLRHLDILAIHLTAELRDSVQPDVTLQCRRDP